MYLEQLADIAEKFTLEIPPLIRENLEGAAKTSEELIDCCCGGGLSLWEGKGMNSTYLVNWSTITRTYSLPCVVRGKGPRKSRCTLSIGAPAWYLSISALA